MVSKAGIFFCWLLLASCDVSPTLDDRVQSYINDLNRYEGLSLSSTSESLSKNGSPKHIFPKYSFPSPKFTIQPLTTFDVSLLEFLSLQHCDIGYYISTKNSVLGKVMTPSQRLIYETNIIRAIEACDFDSASFNGQSELLSKNVLELGSVYKSGSLKSKLLQIAKVKRSELNRAFANAMWGGAEAQRFFSFSNGYLPMALSRLDFQTVDNSLNALSRIANDLQQLPNINDGLLETHLKTLYHSEYAGQLILTLVLLTETFDEVSGGLNVLQPNDVFCRGPIIFLKQQLQKHYLKGLQPYMAKINSSAYIQLTHISNLRAVSSDYVTKEVDGFLSQFSLIAEHGIWRKYQLSSQSHARAWDRILRECDAF